MPKAKQPKRASRQQQVEQQQAEEEEPVVVADDSEDADGDYEPDAVDEEHEEDEDEEDEEEEEAPRLQTARRHFIVVDDDDSDDFEPPSRAQAARRQLALAAAAASTPAANVPAAVAAIVQRVAAQVAAERAAPGYTPPEPTPDGKRARRVKETAEDRIDRLHPEVKGVWMVLKPPENVPPVQQPLQLIVKLLPFQLEGVAWLAHQEVESVFHGGILADEMGMGKTIQTIALLLLRRSPPGRPTMIVCPTVALLQWNDELKRRTLPDALNTLIYHGGSRMRDLAALKQHDIILTTYATVESEWRRQHSGFTRNGERTHERSVLHSIDFHRVVLDEAHFIKDRSSSTARAVFSLQRDYAWSLTGTPLQNRVSELFSLVKFLRADPYAYYFCRQCPCKSATWNFVKSNTCSCCGHRSMSHFCWWNKEILRPILKYGQNGPGRVAFDNLRQLLTAVMLRRTKVDRGSELGLPPRVVHTRRDLFTQEEEDFYEALFSETKTKFESFVKTGTVLNNYAHIFELLMRMRQSVNHPWLVTHRADAATDRDVCGICHEQAEDPISTECKHVFCREEMSLYVTSNTSTDPVCPVCFRALSVDLTQPTMETEEPADKPKSKRPNIVRRLDIEAWQSSTKIEALLEELTACQTESCSIKSIVFSQFTTFLDLLEWRLQRGGIRVVKLDGRMQPMHRKAVIDAFNTKPEITVFLISLKAGGLALNLTAASRVYIMDPWWNPAAESQAMDRIHRLGQNRPVEVRRLIVENSIESRIDQLQEKKRLLFESTVGMDSTALNRLTEEDLQFLFF